MGTTERGKTEGKDSCRLVAACAGGCRLSKANRAGEALGVCFEEEGAEMSLSGSS